MNSSITAFNASLNATVRSNADYIANMTVVRGYFADFLTNFNASIMGEMMESFANNYMLSILSTLVTYVNGLEYAFPSPARALIFEAFNITGGSNNCSYNLATNANNLFTAFGGARAFYNCGDYEQIVNTEILQLLNSAVSAIMLDFNSTMALFNTCATVRPNLFNGQNFSLVECVGNVVAGMSGEQSYSDYLLSEISGIFNTFSKIFTLSANRYKYCITSRFQSVNYTSSFLTQRFLNCTNLTMPTTSGDGSG